VARPTKLTQTIAYRDERGVEQELEVGEAIVRYVRIGAPLKSAAKAAGVSEASVRRWLARGREWLDGEAAPPAREAPYASFASEIARAQGAAVAFHFAVIRRAAGQGSWRASAWWLEHHQLRAPGRPGAPRAWPPSPEEPAAEQAAAYEALVAKLLAELEAEG